ncbi:hypothetical protein JB92DRAFT_2825507 [Gautieria morchelliformis]|nr:hypothetical protein JB92DRAFT_2825507 [Gautieria morchelliformis]
MQVVPPDPSDPYLNPPPTLTNLKLHKKWHLTHLGLALLSLAVSAPPENDRGSTGNYGTQITMFSPPGLGSKAPVTAWPEMAWASQGLFVKAQARLRLSSALAPAPWSEIIAGFHWSLSSCIAIAKDGSSLAGDSLNQREFKCGVHSVQLLLLWIGVLIQVKWMLNYAAGTLQINWGLHLQFWLMYWYLDLIACVVPQLSFGDLAHLMTRSASENFLELWAVTQALWLSLGLSNPEPGFLGQPRGSYSPAQLWLCRSLSWARENTSWNIVQRICQELMGIQISRKKNTDQEWLPHPPRPGASLRYNQSGEELLTPNFTEDIQHEHNHLILDKSADLAVTEINASPSELMLKLYPSIPFKCPLLYELAKTTFRVYVTKYQAQNNPKKKMEVVNRKKMVWRLTAVLKFMVNYHLNPSALLHLDWMLDEDSKVEGCDKFEDEKELPPTTWNLWRRSQ